MRKVDPIPDESTIEEASEFWDTHSVADYPSQMEIIFNAPMAVVMKIIPNRPNMDSGGTPAKPVQNGNPLKAPAFCLLSGLRTGFWRGCPEYIPGVSGQSGPGAITLFTWQFYPYPNRSRLLTGAERVRGRSTCAGSTGPRLPG